MKLVVLWSFYIPPAILGPSRKGLNNGVWYKYGLDFMSVNLQIDKNEYDNTEYWIRQGRGNIEATKKV